jgi:hypothetical protein
MRALHFRAYCNDGRNLDHRTARVFAARDAGVPAISPTEALERLMAGNELFQNDKTDHPVFHSKRREELVGGQSPFAVILSCSDSRDLPEMIFDEGPGRSLCRARRGQHPLPGGALRV